MTLRTSGISGFYIYSPSVTPTADLHGLQVDGEVFASHQHPQPSWDTPVLTHRGCPTSPSSSLPPDRGQTPAPELGSRFGQGQGTGVHREHRAEPRRESCPNPGSALLVLLCSSRDNSMKCLPGKLARPLPHQSHLPGPNWKKPASGAAFSKQIMAANNWAAPRQLRPALHGPSPVGSGGTSPLLQTPSHGAGRALRQGWAPATSLHVRCCVLRGQTKPRGSRNTHKRAPPHKRAEPNEIVPGAMAVWDAAPPVASLWSQCSPPGFLPRWQGHCEAFKLLINESADPAAGSAGVILESGPVCRQKSQQKSGNLSFQPAAENSK